MRNNIVPVTDASTVADAGAVLSIQPRIASTRQLTLNNEVAIDGSITVTIHYLLNRNSLFPKDLTLL